MSPGSAPILLLKAAPEPEQLADRLDGGPWMGIEVPLMPAHVADDAAVERAIEHVRAAAPEHVAAEAPVAWPSGAHLRVDRLHDEARAGPERSARFAAGGAGGRGSGRGRAAAGELVPAGGRGAGPGGAHLGVDRLEDGARAALERSARFGAGVGSRVLTIHLYTPLEPEEYRRSPGV